MKRYLIILATLISNFYCHASQEPQYHGAAIAWTDSLDLPQQEQSPSVPGGVINLRELHLQALDKLVTIQTDSREDFETLDKNKAICLSYVQNKRLHHAARVYARINLGIIEKTLAFTSSKDIVIDDFAQASRRQFITALAMARKSKDWRQAQEKMAHDQYNNFRVSRLKNLHQPITAQEINEMETKLNQDPKLQFSY